MNAVCERIICAARLDKFRRGWRGSIDFHDKSLALLLKKIQSQIKKEIRVDFKRNTFRAINLAVKLDYSRSHVRFGGVNSLSMPCKDTCGVKILSDCLIYSADCIKKQGIIP